MIERAELASIADAIGFFSLVLAMIWLRSGARIRLWSIFITLTAFGLIGGTLIRGIDRSYEGWMRWFQ